MTASTVDTNNQELPDLPEGTENTKKKDGGDGSDGSGGPPDEPKKKPKKQGPIRTGLVGALVLLGVLCFAYGKFFLDSNLKSLVEIVGTNVNGAEVNVDKVTTSFFGGSFSFEGLQVTDKSMPSRNIVNIGEIHFHFVWDALLRAKFVIDESSIKDIQVHAQREKPGHVVPMEEKSGDSKQMAELEQAVLDQGKAEFEGNALGDIANILDGGDPADQLKNIQGELITEQKIKEFEDRIKSKEDTWKAELAKLKQADDLKKTSKDLKSFKFNKKRPDKSLKELSKILKSTKNKVKSFNDSYKTIKDDVKAFGEVPKKIDGWIQEDIKALKDRFKIPDINLGDLSKQLFAKMFLSKLGEYRKYVVMARDYMPPSKEQKIANAKKEGKSQADIDKIKAEKKPTVHKRRGGTNVKFPITTGYPLFWLKKSIVSSKSTDSQTSGDVEGVFENFTSDPTVINKVATINIKGDFPHQKISGLNASIVIDRTQAIPKESVRASIDSYPVGEQLFSKSEKLTFGFNKAQGRMNLKMISTEGKVESVLKNEFTKVDYRVDAKSATVKDMFTNVVNGVGLIHVDAVASGSWEDLNWRIKSNLGNQLSKGLKKEVQIKVDSAKAKVEQLVQDRIGGKKKNLLSKVNAAKKSVTGQLDAKKNEVNKLQDGVKKSVDGKKNSGKSSAKKKAKKKGKKLLKKFKKFKF